MSRLARKPLRKMLFSRIPAALTTAGIVAGVTANPKPGRALPYVHIAESDEDDSFRTLSTIGSVLNSTIRVWAESIGIAEDIADVIIQNQTNRASLPTLDSPHKIILVDLLSSPTIPAPSAENEDLFQIPIRLRYQIHSG